MGSELCEYGVDDRHWPHGLQTRECQRPGAAIFDSYGLVLNTGHMQITATDFKARCLAILDQVQW